MKMLTIFLFATCLQVHANISAQTVTLKVSNASLENVFREIQKQTGYDYIINTRFAKIAKSVSIEAKNTSLEQVLQECFKDQPFTYEILDKTIIIKEKESPKNVDPAISGELPVSVDVHGTVKDEEGKPAVGVAVRIKGTTRGTTTNDNGEFALTGVDENATLVFSSVNLQTFEVAVKGKNDFAITLKAKISQLADVVIGQINTGYQTINKERAVGAYSTLDSVAYERRAGMGILQRLDATVTGVLYSKLSNIINNIFPIQSVRGVSTFGYSTSMSPLIVIDNFPYTGDLSTINPNDVLDIVVLKDAAATSIYGARGGNGVIVITTKKAKFNQPLHVSYSTNITIQDKPNLYYYPRMSTSDFIDVEQFLFNKGYYNSNLTNTTNRPVVTPVTEILNKLRTGAITQGQANSQLDSLRGIDIRNDLNKYVYQRKVSQQYYINLSGGNNLINYTFSGGYNHSIPNIQGRRSDDQFTLGSINTIRPLKNLELEIGINYSRGTVRSTTGFSLPNYPYAKLVDASGNYLAIPFGYRMSYIDTVGGGNLLDWHYRPLEEIRLADNTVITQALRLNFRGSYKIAPWLKAEILYQNLQQTGTIRNNQSLQSYSTRDLINRFTQISGTTVTRRIPLGAILDVSNSLTAGTNWRGQLSLNKNWSSKHDLSALIGGEVSETTGQSYSNRFYGYNPDLAYYVSGLDYNTNFPIFGNLSGSTRIPQNISLTEGTINRFVSFLANASYTYDKRYTIYASARRDGANLFGVNTNNRWKPLWSSGVSWDVSKSNFYAIHWMPYLRVRASFGYSGNVNNGLSGLPTVAYNSQPGFTNLPYAQIGNAPNPDLKWEQIRTINAAIDFGLLSNRLTGSIDIFNKQSTDIIWSIPFDPTTGITNYVVNYASMKANGVELNLHSKNTTGAIKWVTDFGLTYTKVVVTKVSNGGFKTSDFVGGSLMPSVGRIAYGLTSYKWAGLDPLTGDPQGYLNGQVSKNYTSMFNDSIQNQVFNGSALPLYFGFLNNSISWKNLSLSFTISYAFDYYFRRPVFGYSELFLNLSGANGNTADYIHRWIKPGDELHTSIPSMTYPANSNRDAFYKYSEINILRADNVRLGDVRVQYTWKNKNMSKLFVKDIQLFLYVNNLNVFIWRANKDHLDPDYTGTANVFPPPRTYTIGLNTNF